MSVEFILSGGDSLETQAADFDLNGGFTVAAWIKTGAAPGPYGAIVAKPLNSQLVLGIKQDRTLYLVVADDAGWSYPTADAVPAGTWSHVSATYDGAADEVNLFINGTRDFDSPRTCTTGMTEVSSPLHIAGGASTAGYEGSIQDLAIWNRALSAEEVSSVAGGRLVAGFIPDGLTGWWPLHVPGDAVFDEAVAVGDLGLQDMSGNVPTNDIDAAINGSPSWRDDSPGLHWPSRPYVTPFTTSGASPAGRLISIGALFIRSGRVVLAG